jgi:hypothetical protein
MDDLVYHGMKMRLIDFSIEKNHLKTGRRRAVKIIESDYIGLNDDEKD